MPGINVEELYAQRAEATGVDGDRIPFDFAGRTWTFRDPQTLTDEEKEEISEIDFDPDMAAWYMGDDQYAEFVAATATIDGADGKQREIQGGSGIFLLAFQEHMSRVRDAVETRPTRASTSSRRRRRR
ncbi:hypothetical protein [Tomitella cavernea]|uniref:Uncharacterized protein n=1 Tax=Tomitella cavernea TaxID=1387982 RepID=A0ABP9CG74_9ACTN|nr:hypothetical protein [Tomitella cavernea]